MTLFDSHTHVNFRAFKDDSADVIRRSLDFGIGMNLVGTNFKTSQSAINQAKNFNQAVYATVGLHPVHLFEQSVNEEGEAFRTKAEQFDYDAFKELALEAKVIALGEMGLDYFYLPLGLTKAAAQEIQKKVLLAGMQLAQEIGKPMVFHVRPSPNTFDAYDDIYEIITGAVRAQPLRAVVHCFGGTLEQARRFLDLGLYIGITGIVTFKNARGLQEVVKVISLEKILIETDAPFLAPEPYRGQRNEPMYVKYVAEKIAMIKGLSFEAVAKATTENAKNLFHLDV